MASRITLLPSQIERLNGDMTGSGVLQLSDIESQGIIRCECGGSLPAAALGKFRLLFFAALLLADSTEHSKSNCRAYRGKPHGSAIVVAGAALMRNFASGSARHWAYADLGWNTATVSE
jgi:hypothetical protein